jgi:hypothetical protein
LLPAATQSARQPRTMPGAIVTIIPCPQAKPPGREAMSPEVAAHKTHPAEAAVVPLEAAVVLPMAVASACQMAAASCLPVSLLQGAHGLADDM